MSPSDALWVRPALLSLYPALASLEPPMLERLLAHAELVRVPAGTVLFDEHQPCNRFPMLVEGAVRVSKAAPSGRELQLYRLVPGDACILTSSCLLGGSPYTARGIAELDSTIVVVGEGEFGTLVAESPHFRAYVFALFADRIGDLMQLVESVAFQRLDQRLAALLLGKGRIVHTTHQQLADELGSVREMVTRLLRSFADQGIVAVAREQIEIIDPQALRRLAGS